LIKTKIVLGLIFLTCCMLLTRQTFAASNEAEIRQVFENWAKAFSAHDIKGIMSIYAPNVVAFDFVAPLQYVGKDAYQKDYEEFVAQFDGPIDVEFHDLKIVAGNDVAFGYTLERFSGKMKNGQKMDLWGRCTSGFQKINGKWLDVHDHCSVPADFDTGKALLDLKP